MKVYTSKEIEQRKITSGIEGQKVQEAKNYKEEKTWE